jgi:DNA polymerase III delta' subunit
MPLREILGQPQVTGPLRRALTQDRLHHALLFYGPDGVGKRACAIAFAQLLLCTRPVRSPVAASPSPHSLEGGAGGAGGEGLLDACGECGACVRVARAFQPEARAVHPDLHIVERGLNDSGQLRKKIVVEQMREMQAAVRYVAYEGGRRVVYIEDVDLMEDSAANAFLKTLEEPAEGVYFLLTTRNLRGVMETVVSRCQSVRFAPLPTAVLSALARRHPQGARLSEAAAQTLARLSGGSIGLALHWLEADLLGGAEGGEWEGALSAFVLSRVRALDGSSGPKALVQAWEALKPYASSKQDAELRRLLYLLSAWYRDVMILMHDPGASSDLLTYPALRGECAARAERLSSAQVRWRLQAIRDAERDLFERTGGNRQLTLDALALYLAGLDAGVGVGLYPPAQAAQGAL